MPSGDVSGVRASNDCGSYFYIPNTRKVYFTMAKNKTAKLQCYRWNHDRPYTRPCYLSEPIENLYSPRMVVYNKKTKINTIENLCMYI